MAVIASEFFFAPLKKSSDLLYCFYTGLQVTWFYCIYFSISWTVFPKLFSHPKQAKSLSPLGAVTPYRLLISLVVQVQVVRWEGQIGGAKERKALVGDSRSTPLLHCVPSWFFFSHQLMRSSTKRHLNTWLIGKSILLLELPSQLSRLNFENNSSHWMLKPFRVLVTSVAALLDVELLKKPWPFVSHGLFPESSPICSAFADFSLSCTGECSLWCAILHVHTCISLVFRIQDLSSDRYDQVIRFEVVQAFFHFLLLNFSYKIPLGGHFYIRYLGFLAFFFKLWK